MTDEGLKRHDDDPLQQDAPPADSADEGGVAHPAGAPQSTGEGTHGFFASMEVTAGWGGWGASPRPGAIDVAAWSDLTNSLAAFSASVGPQFRVPVLSVEPFVPFGDPAVPGTKRVPPGSASNETFESRGVWGGPSTQYGAISDLVARRGPPVQIEVGPYRPGREPAGSQIEQLSDRSNEPSASSLENRPALDVTSPPASAAVPMVPGATGEYQPLGVPLPVVLVQLDDPQGLIAAELEAHSGRMKEISKQSAEEVVRCHEWVRWTEERRFDRD
jgi:hypothetical protein